MADQFSLPPDRQRIDSVIRNLDGKEVLRSSFVVETEVDDQGAMTTLKQSESFVLQDDTVWNHAQSMRQHDPVHLAVCEVCRSESHPHASRSHGLMAVHNAARCRDCGRLCCPRHARQGSDGMTRCVACARRLQWKKILHRIFFVRVGEE